MEKQLQEFNRQAKLRSDKHVNYFLALYFFIGLILAFYYDTWLIATGVGGLCIVAYYSARYFLPESNTYQYVLGAVAGVFMAQFVYQMHGMFEMHFFAFIGSAILVTYRNWKLQLPLAAVVLLHHAAFGYLQFTGFDKIYFTQLEYMGMQTFVIHLLLASAIFYLCGLWASSFKKYGENYIVQSFKIGQLQEANRQKEEMIQMANTLQQSNQQLKEANEELETIFNSVEEVLFSMDTASQKITQLSRACKKVFGYSREEFMSDSSLWSKLIHPADKFVVKLIEKKIRKGKSVFQQYRIIDKNKHIHWLELKMIPSLDEQKKVSRIDGICNDITQKKILENKLAEEKSRQQQQITAAVITAQEKERYFLGQELHDNINPILATAKLYIDCVMSEGEDSRQLLKESKGFITTAMNEIRVLSKSLVPPSLGEIGLIDAIADMTDHISAVNQLVFVHDWHGFDETALSDQLKLTIYRIVQEQMNNILKHSNARQVHISLHQDGYTSELVIKDDGIGFDLNTKRNGVGLQNINSRTELFNGKALIITEPGKGCELTVNFNLQTPLTEFQQEARA